MDANVTIGCIVVAAALTVVIALTLWARRTINRIAEDGYRTARETLRELNNGK